MYIQEHRRISFLLLPALRRTLSSGAHGASENVLTIRAVCVRLYFFFLRAVREWPWGPVLCIVSFFPCSSPPRVPWRRVRRLSHRRSSASSPPVVRFPAPWTGPLQGRRYTRVPASHRNPPRLVPFRTYFPTIIRYEQM